MSIEQTLERIAVALEKQNELTAAIVQGKAAVAAPVPAAVKETKVKKDAPAPPVAEPEQDPFSGGEEAAVTFETLTELLKAHAKSLGTKLTVALIIKHGADRTTPKMNTIPEANFKACFDEATLDLKKVAGKAK